MWRVEVLGILVRGDVWEEYLVRVKIWGKIGRGDVWLRLVREMSWQEYW